MAATAARILTRRLDEHSNRPIAVAFSGGGDSLALILAAQAWARRAGRRLVCLTVDHGLSPDSARWTEDCARRAGDLGLEHRALVWAGLKPTTGLPAAARTARHRLLANAARQAGASVLLVGHTADDRLEARLMHAEGSSVSEPREWSPSPVWPEGRGVFILRPLIEVRREPLRVGLREIGESWLDDPANANPTSVRARVRQEIAGGGHPGPPAERPLAEDLLEAATIGWAGDIALPLAVLAASAPAPRRRFLGAALLSAAGTSTPPRGEALVRLWDRLCGPPPMAATLAGARIECDGTTVRVMRDDGAMRDPVASLNNGRTVFDGRFEIDLTDRGGVLTSMSGHMARLSRSERDHLKTLPPAARRSLPVVIGEDGSATCPLVAPGSARCAQPLVAARLNAALGAITREGMIGRIGEIAPGVLDTSASIERSVNEPA